MNGLGPKETLLAVRFTEKVIAMMRNEDFSDGYFTGLLWGEKNPDVAQMLNDDGKAGAYAEAVQEHISQSELGDKADKKVWGEGFVYGARAAMRRMVANTTIIAL